MTMSNRFFVLYISSRPVQVRLDLMRLLCNPATTSQAHLTVRGPYISQRMVRGDWLKVRNISVAVQGVGAFLTSRQSTVFLRCQSADLRRIWWKRDYKGYEPHITIYDGRSRAFATRVAEVLARHELSFEFTADRLYEHASGHGQQRLDFLWRDYEELFRELGGRSLSRELLRAMIAEERLVHLDKLAQSLSVLAATEESLETHVRS